MHVLDFILYFPLALGLWWLMGKLSDDQITNNDLVGPLPGITIEIVFLGFYTVVFAVFDWNWIDIFNGMCLPDITFKL
ncbi:hypothetical protein UFOVP1247_140 [uncultured Caudovirales phage]|uniref:Uncharacterized protein n=1 Tax=uncultured Caudovirales phage TaxID=2100421 RepID=A0A6J5R9N5_9CAUD|nr:hypothetical protein UFOVP970_180 [uncultured Caudovirales phage]CAB4193753.1 hypothetical protein UFOVP1247_140 [uncultured Caudovirales phage]